MLRSLAAGAIVFLLGLGVLSLSRIRQAQDQPAVISTGPAAGTDLAIYAEQRESDLAGRSGTLSAVVSFSEYVPEEEVAALVRGMKVTAYLVTAPLHTAEVTRDVAVWRREFREAAVADRDEIKASLQAGSDPASAASLQAALNTLDVTIGALDGNIPVVFGVVIEGDAASLRRLVGKPKVRIVDPVERVVADRGAVRGARPEETRSGEPSTRP